MTPTRDPDLPEQRLRDAFAQRAETTTVGEPHGMPQDDESAPATATSKDRGVPGSSADVTMLAAPDIPRHTRRWLQPAAAAAVIVLLAGGLFVAGHLSRDRDSRTVSSAPPRPACGTELPFEFPVPDGFDGPVSGPVTAEMEAHEHWNGTVLRWQGDLGLIDVYWPSWLPQDPESFVPSEEILVYGSDPQEMPGALGGHFAGQAPDGWTTQEIGLSTTALGAGQCSVLNVIVTTPDAESTESLTDQIATALVGPDGVVPGIKPTLVTGTTAINALPEIERCSDSPGANGDTVEDQGTYETPSEALAYFLPTELPRLPQGGYEGKDGYETHAGYEQALLPDGSYVFLFRPDPEHEPERVTVIVHVDPVDGGWTATSWESTSCA